MLVRYTHIFHVRNTYRARPPHACYYSPGMPEMLSPSAALVGSGLGKTVALVTDGRFSGASHGKICVRMCVMCVCVYCIAGYIGGNSVWRIAKKKLQLANINLAIMVQSPRLLQESTRLVQYWRI